ncbi:MAG: pyridoxal phosphate-dependent aminotransferase [Thermoprotei archaeon]|nr:MAG: pyridoxal phosphate-dependent aminotransferase [Thermoprotei archaeon]
MRFSERTLAIKSSGIRRLFDLAQRTPGVISLGIGEPDQDTPVHVKEAAKKALDEGYTHYTPNAGFPDLREALAEKLRLDNGIDAAPDEVIVTGGGGTGALMLSALCLINPGDEVLLPDPGFVVYEAVVLMAGGKPVYVPLKEEDGFRMLPSEVEKRITSKTKCIIVNTPSNPTGGVLEEEDLKGIADLAVKHDLYVISDEVYEKLVYDGHRHLSIASLPRMKERTVTVNSFSKTYAMTGWRIGYAAAPKELIDQMVKLQQFTMVHAPAVSQRAALAALKGPQDFVKEMAEEYDKRRRFIVDRLNSIEGLSCLRPKGAFYVFLNIKKLGMRSEEVAMALLERAKVVTVPGVAFGPGGEGYLRISYSRPIDQLEEACSRIEKAIEELKGG